MNYMVITTCYTRTLVRLYLHSNFVFSVLFVLFFLPELPLNYYCFAVFVYEEL